MGTKVTLLVSVSLALALTGWLFTGAADAKIDPSTIVGLWLFDEGGGDVAIDSSGNGLDGKIEGSPMWVAGKFGQALELNGTDSYVEVPDHVNPTEAITVSAWVKSATETWNQHGWMVEKRDAFILHPVQGSKDVAFPICNGACWNKPGGWSDGAVGPDDITQWHMYTGTFDSATGEWKLYIDGEEKSSLDLDKAPLNEDPGPLYIGQDTCCAGRFGAGTVDEVAIFNVALSADDIMEMATKGLATLTAVQPAGKLAITWAEAKSIN